MRKPRSVLGNVPAVVERVEQEASAFESKVLELLTSITVLDTGHIGLRPETPLWTDITHLGVGPIGVIFALSFADGPDIF